MAILLKFKKCYGKITTGREVYEGSGAAWGSLGQFLVAHVFVSLSRIRFRFESIIQRAFRVIQSIQRSPAGLSGRLFERSARYGSYC